MHLPPAWNETLGRDVELSSLSSSSTFRSPPPSFREDPLPLESEDPTGTPQIAYRLAQIIGKGGMGEVYSARQASLRREVAAKKLKAVDAGRPAARASFLAEALVTARLEHPNIVPVHDLVTLPDGDLCMSMKLVAGQAWSQRLQKGQPAAPLDEHLEILVQVCNAVAFAHSVEIVHNDIKPANVMLGAFGEVLLMDWGVAVDVAEAPRGLRHKSAIRHACGTPSYMPPELASGRGADIGPATDVYLLGSVLCRLLTGKAPHAGTFAYAVQHAASGALPVLDEALPAELRRLCLDALAPDPGRRLASALDFQRRLRAYLRHRESVRLSEHAAGRLEDAAEAEGPAAYAAFAEAIAGFGQAASLWAENPAARDGARAARVAYARHAHGRGDLGLAAAQLEGVADADELRAAIAATGARRAREERSRHRLRRGLTGAVLVIIVGLLVAVGLLERKNRDIETRNDEIHTQKATIEAGFLALASEKQRVELQRDRARERGEIALETLHGIVERVEQKLLDDHGEARAQKVAEAIMQDAQAGWKRLRDTGTDPDETDHGAALATLRYGLMLMGKEARYAEALAEIERGVAAIESLAEPYRSRLKTRLDLCEGLEYQSACLRHLGRADEARAVHTRRRAIAEELYAAHPEDSRVQALLADVLARAGALREDVGDLAGALALFDRERALYQALAEAQPDSDFPRQYGYSLGRQGLVLLRQGRLEDAIAAFELRRELRGALVEREPDRLGLRQEYTHALEGLAAAVRKAGDYGRAGELLVESLQQRKKIVELNPDNLDNQRLYCSAMLHVADDARAYGDLDTAAELSATARDTAREQLARSPDYHALREYSAASHESLADIASMRAATADAVASYRAAVAERRLLAEAWPERTRPRRQLAITLGKLGGLLARAPGVADSLMAASLEEATALLRTVIAEAPDNADARSALALVLAQTGVGHSLRGAHDEAEPLMTEGLALRRALAEASPESANAAREVTMSLYELYYLELLRGDQAAALAWLEQAIANHEPLAGTHPTQARELEAMRAEAARLRAALGE